MKSLGKVISLLNKTSFVVTIIDVGGSGNPLHFKFSLVASYIGFKKILK